MSKKFTEVQVDITMEDYTLWAEGCSIEEAKELAIEDIKDNLEDWLAVSINEEGLGDEIMEGGEK
tara:strand:- start:98 stop:292 length:195 start_codon:yes stop_codon:yes gene_type:complete